MDSALRRLDAGRLDGRRSLPEPSFRIPDLRSGHHRDRDLRTHGDNHNNNNDFNDGRSSVNNNYDYHNNDQRPPSPPPRPQQRQQPQPPQQQPRPPTHEVRRPNAQRWLNMGYRETLADLMT